MLTQEKYDMAMQGIQSCKTGFADLLSSAPNVVLQSNHMFDKLGHSINMLAQASGLKLSGLITTVQQQTDTDAPEAMTHIAGRAIQVQPTEPLSIRTQPAIKMLTDMQLFVSQADDDLLEMTPKELKDQYGDVTLRGLAGKLGMDVSPTDAVTNELIRDMKAKKIDAETMAKQEAVVTQTAQPSTAPSETTDELKDPTPPPPPAVVSPVEPLPDTKAAKKKA